MRAMLTAAKNGSLFLQLDKEGGDGMKVSGSCCAMFPTHILRNTYMFLSMHLAPIKRTWTKVDFPRSHTSKWARRCTEAGPK